ncbi:MAG: hypothetical protein IIT65_01185, partial [Lachnospiraceae bacterium]|nr:hypothetical protein [Lachnospiraceae bacterium]
MIINGKTVIVYDIEVFPNVFSCTLKNTENNQVVVFEISNRKNQVQQLVQFFKTTDYLFCGYNNIHYDNPIVSFIILNERTIPNDYSKITKKLFDLSDIIVNSEDFESWKEYKYANLFDTLDLLTMLFSQKLRVGLKEMQVTMQYKNVQEYEGDFNKPLPDEEIDNMLAYNLNDVLSTEELLNRCQKEINLRIGIQKEFGINVLSKDGMTIGTEILKAKYLEKTGKTWWDIKNLRSPCDIINLNEVIFPFIKFETPVLQSLLDEMKQQSVSPGERLGLLQLFVGAGPNRGHPRRGLRPGRRELRAPF